ncbi:hypothetical protein LEMLEM_LOCUS11218, partial [Lemmus lemmus]
TTLSFPPVLKPTNIEFSLFIYIYIYLFGISTGNAVSSSFADWLSEASPTEAPGLNMNITVHQNPPQARHGVGMRVLTVNPSTWEAEDTVPGLERMPFSE